MLRAYIGLFCAAIALMAVGCGIPAVILAVVALSLALRYEIRLIASTIPRPNVARVARVAAKPVEVPEA